MPTRKPLHKYPAEYAALFRAVVEHETLTITCASPAAASNLRRELYNFRRVFVEDTPRPPTQANAWLLARIEEIVLALREEKLILSVNGSVYAQAVRNFLEDLLNES